MSRALVVRLDSLGDVLVSGPAIRAVAARRETLVLAGPRGVAAAGLLPGVADVLVTDAPWISSPAPAATRQGFDGLVALIRDADVDEVVILTSFHQSPLPTALAARLAGATRITGASVDYAGSLLDVRLRPGEDLPEDIPEPERALAIAAAAGFPLPAGDDGRLAVTATADDAPARFAGGGHVVVHPGAAVPARAWPAERHRELVARLAARGERVVVTGGPGERALTSYVAGDDAEDAGGALGLTELAGVLAAARVVVVGNTGPAHLAAAVGTPVVSLFSPVVPPARWAPYGVASAVLGRMDAACAGTRARVCPVPGHPCLAGVGADEVLAAIDRLARAEAAA